jgi:hypothetical protein
MCALGNFWCCREPFVAGAAFSEVIYVYGMEFRYIIYKNSIPTAKKTLCPCYRDKPVNNVQGEILIFLKII